MKALILTPYHEGDLSQCLPVRDTQLVICADTAYQEAEAIGCMPDVVIGDFDHERIPPANCGKIVRVPAEKDDTDTMLCIKYALDAGADEIVIIGGIGGRLDHTVANLQSLAYAESHGVSAVLMDSRNEARILSGHVRIPKKSDSYLSVFAYGGVCHGVSETGVRYPLYDAELTPDFPLGVSNEITDEYADIEVKEGRLLLIVSKKESESGI